MLSMDLGLNISHTYASPCPITSRTWRLMLQYELVGWLAKRAIRTKLYSKWHLAKRVILTKFYSKWHQSTFKQNAFAMWFYKHYEIILNFSLFFVIANYLGYYLLYQACLCTKMFPTPLQLSHDPVENSSFGSK